MPLFDPPPAQELPPLELLDDPPTREPSYSPEALEAMSRLVELKLQATSASRSRWSRCIRARWSRASRCGRPRA